MTRKQILNPLTRNMDNIPSVLMMLASQESCDGDPYDQMQEAAEYIVQLETHVTYLTGILKEKPNERIQTFEKL